MWQTVVIPHGDEQFALPLVEENRMFLVTALRMDAITNSFPSWNIDKGWGEIYAEFTRSFPGATLPKHAGKIGGKGVDLLIGIRYIRFFPKLLFTLPSGLAIFESRIAAPNGETLVLAGPHSSWDYATSQASVHSAHIFFSNEMRAYYHHAQVLTTPISLPTPDLEVVDTCHADQFQCLNFCDSSVNVSNSGQLDESETAVFNLRTEADKLFSPEIFGTDVDYRCHRCRNCNDCKNSEHLKMILNPSSQLSNFCSFY